MRKSIQRLFSKPAARAFRHALVWFSIALGALFAGSALWIRHTFGPVSVDQLLMHLPGSGGAESSSSEGDYLLSFVRRAVLLPLLVVGGVAFSYYLVVRRLRLSREAAQQGRQRRGARTVVAGLAAFAVLLGGVLAFGDSIRLAEYAQASAASGSMADYYVSPVADVQTVLETPEEPKNLITIFLESTEESFSDTTVFETDMMQPLNEVTEEWSRFSALNMYEGSGWTMAGITGTECGIPLRGIGDFSFGVNHNDIGADNSGYMSGAVCIGDVLKRAGYENVFMGGADAGFAAKRNYLTAHGYDQVQDLGYWQSRGETEISPVWGLSDRRLMENAKQEVTRLYEQDQPFSLTLLTLDIHEPLHLFESCDITTLDPAESVQRCSASAVADFISYLGEEGYLDDTVVFITGDHEKMLADGVAFTERLQGKTSRPLYNRLWSPDAVEIERSKIDQLSVYATLLDVLDLGREDGRAGVGVSALVPEAEVTGMVALQPEEYQALVKSRSRDLYRHIWLKEELSPAS